MIVNGRQITKDLLREVRGEIEGRVSVPVVRAIVLAPSAATESYLAIKERRAREAGMKFEVIRMASDSRSEDIKQKIELPGADAVIVQLPLPEGIDTTEVLNVIPLEKDADVLSEGAHLRFNEGRGDALLPPVVAAIKEILERAGVDPAGKRAVVIGSGWLVGEPCATWLRTAGADVTVVTRESGDLSVLKSAELIISGAGAPGLITPDLLTEGVVLIDAGTSESGGAIVGDADPSCAEVCSVFTPVPGGVGPVAVACLFKNVAKLANRNGLQSA